MTLYEILGVQPDAPLEEIRQAYRTLTLRLNPDRAPEHLAAFNAVTEAFAILSQPQKRAEYDAELGLSPAARGSGRKPPRQAAKSGPLQARLQAHRRKKRLLIATGTAACLALLSPLLIAAAQWGLRAWWRASGVVMSTEKWHVENLRFYPATDSEKEAVPGAAVTLRGYVKGLPGCYVVPARGSVVAEQGNRATIRVELQRLGAWNKEGSYMGTCTQSFAPIEAPLAGNIKTWDAIDLIAVDTDGDLERVFSEAEVQWIGKH